MNTDTPTRNKSRVTDDGSIDVAGPERGDVPTDHLDLPTDAQLLGVDAHGHTHLHSPRQDWVCVITPDGDVVHEQDLGVRSIWDWVAHTEQCRGEWESIRYQRGGWVENLVQTIVEAGEQDAGDEHRVEGVSR